MKNRNLPDVLLLLRATNIPDKGELTKAGRALQKHGERAYSLFPKPQGNVQAINEQALSIVEEILTSSKQTVTIRHHARFGEILDIYAPNGRGIRYDAQNNFIGFLEKSE